MSGRVCLLHSQVKDILQFQNHTPSSVEWEQRGNTHSVPLNCLQSKGHIALCFWRCCSSTMLIPFMFIPSCRGGENQINLCFSMPEWGMLFHKAIYMQAPCEQNLKWTIYLTLTPTFLSIIRVAGKRITFLYKLWSLLNLYEGHGIATLLQGFLLEKAACYNSSPTF